MKPKTKKVVKHISDDSDNDSELEIQNKSEESIEESQIVNLRNLKKRLKNCVKIPPKSKKVVKKSSEDNNKEIRKTFVTGEEFKKLQRTAKRLGAKSLKTINM